MNEYFWAFSNETAKDDQVIFSGRRRYSSLWTQILALYGETVWLIRIQTWTDEWVVSQYYYETNLLISPSTLKLIQFPKRKIRRPSNSNTPEAKKERLYQSYSASHITWRAESSFHRPTFIRPDEDWYSSVRRSSSLALDRAVVQSKEAKIINGVENGLFDPDKILFLNRQD